jgi:hypothetical protein
MKAEILVASAKSVNRAVGLKILNDSYFAGVTADGRKA